MQEEALNKHPEYIGNDSVLMETVEKLAKPWLQRNDIHMHILTSIEKSN